jgi:hypothetical protein
MQRKLDAHSPVRIHDPNHALSAKFDVSRAWPESNFETGNGEEIFQVVASDGQIRSWQRMGEIVLLASGEFCSTTRGFVA